MKNKLIKRKMIKKQIRPILILLGKKGIHFFQQIYGKYTFLRKQNRFPSLIFLKICHIKGITAITHRYVTELMNNFFQLHFHLYPYSVRQKIEKIPLQDFPAEVTNINNKPGNLMEQLQGHKNGFSGLKHSGRNIKPQSQMHIRYRKIVKNYQGIYAGVILQQFRILNRMYRSSEHQHHITAGKNEILPDIPLVSHNKGLSYHALKESENEYPLFGRMMPQTKYGTKRTYEYIKENYFRYSLLTTIINPIIFHHRKNNRLLPSAKKDINTPGVFTAPLHQKNTYISADDTLLFHKQKEIHKEVENLKKLIVEKKEIVTEKSVTKDVSINEEIKKNLEIKMLSDRVYQHIEQRIKKERERRGL